MMSVIVSALLLALLFILPGWTWAGNLGFITRRHRTGHCLTALLALTLSVVLLLTFSFFLAEINRFQLKGLLLILGLVACLGGIRDYRNRGRDALRHFARGLLVCLLIAGLFGLLLLIPTHSDWTAGGWDPGVIMDQGLYIGRTGETHPAPGLTAPLLAADQQGLFSSTQAGLREAFPGIPVDSITGAWRFYFCPITPTMVALLYQAGGMAMAMRMPLLIGILAILLFSCVTGKQRLRVLFLTPVLFLLQPILVYHLRTPTSEITELLLLGGFMALWTHLQPHGLRRWLGTALLFLAAVNRVSFELFGAGLILIVACIDADREDRRHAAFDHAALMVGLLAGMAYYALLSPDSLAKLRHIMPTLHAAVLLLLAGALALDLSCARRAYKGIRLDLVLLGLGLVGFLVMEQRTSAPWVEFRRNLLALFSYTGWLLAGVAVPGLWFLFRRPTKIAYWAVFFIFALLVVLCRKHVAELYPWALKRYLVYAVPLFSFLIGATVMTIWRHRRLKWMAPGLLCGVFLFNAPLLRDAWLTPDHEGLSGRLYEVAQHIGDQDIVIVDHFQWGMPLALVYGKNVINGERIWLGKNAERIRHAVALVQEQTGNRHDIVFLTSTDQELDLYLGQIPEVGTLWTAAPWLSQRIQHHPQSRTFTHRDAEVNFRLFKIVARRRPSQ